MLGRSRCGGRVRDGRDLRKWLAAGGWSAVLGLAFTRAFDKAMDGTGILFELG
jgi:hypothetical protein